MIVHCSRYKTLSLSAKTKQQQQQLGLMEEKSVDFSEKKTLSDDNDLLHNQRFSHQEKKSQIGSECNQVEGIVPYPYVIGLEW